MADPLCPLCEERVKPWHETVGDQGDTHLACWQTVLAVSGAAEDAGWDPSW